MRQKSPSFARIGRLKAAPPRSSLSLRLSLRSLRLCVEKNFSMGKGTPLMRRSFAPRIRRSGTVHVFGPVMDPRGAFGMGVIEVADPDAAQRFADEDPAMKSG